MCTLFSEKTEEKTGLHWRPVFKVTLSKIFYAAFKNHLIFIAVDIFGNVASDTLAVCHFTQNAAIGRSDALNCHNRLVGIKADIIGGLTVQVYILGRDLAVCRKAGDLFWSGDKPPLAVRNGNGMIIAYMGIIEAILVVTIID